MTDDSVASGTDAPIEAGVAVYDHEGNALGVVTGMTEGGFEVSIEADVERVDEDGYAEVAGSGTGGDPTADATEESLGASEQEDDPGQEFGEGYLMWRCENCGEMGELEDGLPPECPACGFGEVAKWRED